MKRKSGIPVTEFDICILDAASAKLPEFRKIYADIVYKKKLKYICKKVSACSAPDRFKDFLYTKNNCPQGIVRESEVSSKMKYNLDDTLKDWTITHEKF